MTDAEIHKIYAGVIGIILCLAATWGVIEHERHVGERALLTKQSDSVRVTLGKQADAAQATALTALSDAAKLRTAAHAEVRRDSVRQVANDSAIAESANVRQRAVRDLADSSATLAQLRTDLHDNIDRAIRDSAASADAATQHRRTVAALLATLRADSTAAERQLVVYNVLLKAKLAGDAEIGLLKRDRPSVVGNVIRAVGFTLAGLGAGRVLQ